MYVHVPFCTRRCAYCDFATAVLDEDLALRYQERLERELRTVPAGSHLRSIYVGGGTPTALRPDLLRRLIEFLGTRTRTDVEEWTVEANPETVTAERLAILRDGGVNRISLGNQSFEPAVLQALGREHVPEHTLRALDRLRAHGFENLNVDLMFAAPGESDGQLRRDLDRLAGLSLPHVSAYCLSYEEGTPLTRRLEQGRVHRAEESVELEQYRLVCQRLGAAGLKRYEISNFARPGFESRHNRVYWEGRPYHGVGLGSGSYLDGVRRTNTRLLNEYLGDWDERPPHDAERLGEQARARELVILALRMTEGLSENRLLTETGWTLERLYPGGEVESLLSQGLVLREAGRLRLTDRGFELSDSVFVSLV